MNRVTDIILTVLTLGLWTIFVAAVVRSDGICLGECEGCVYAGWCPQERK